MPRSRLDVLGIPHKGKRAFCLCAHEKHSHSFGPCGECDCEGFQNRKVTAPLRKSFVEALDKGFITLKDAFAAFRELPNDCGGCGGMGMIYIDQYSGPPCPDCQGSGYAAKQA